MSANGSSDDPFQVTVVDYRRYLGQSSREVVPFLGGPTVLLRDGREVPIRPRPPAPGWYRVLVAGRSASPEGPAEAAPLADRPTIRGTFLNGRLMMDRAEVEHLRLVPDEEPALFSSVKARRWHGGALLFEQVEFETGAEEAARVALAGSSTLESLPAVPATLRAAFGLAVIETVALGRGVPVSPHEVRHRLADVATGGTAAADAVLRALEEERARARAAQAALVQRLQEATVRDQLARERGARERLRADAGARAGEALRRAGAALERHRQLGEGQLEVVFAFMGERFVSIVNADTLQVIDSGICLGHPPRDELITLDSLPSVIKEAIDTDALVILRVP